MKPDFRPLLLLELGFVMVFSILLSLLLGLWIDNTFGTRPWGILLFTLLGVGVGTVGVYRLVAATLEELGRRSR